MSNRAAEVLEAMLARDVRRDQRRTRCRVTAGVVVLLGLIVGACVYGLVRMDQQNTEAAQLRREVYQLFDR